VRTGSARAQVRLALGGPGRDSAARRQAGPAEGSLPCERTDEGKSPTLAGSMTDPCGDQPQRDGQVRAPAVRWTVTEKRCRREHAGDAQRGERGGSRADARVTPLGQYCEAPRPMGGWVLPSIDRQNWMPLRLREPVGIPHSGEPQKLDGCRPEGRGAARKVNSKSRQRLSTRMPLDACRSPHPHQPRVLGDSHTAGPTVGLLYEAGHHRCRNLPRSLPSGEWHSEVNRELSRDPTTF